MRILITGGSGYIGSALHRYLIDNEHAVAVVDPRHGDSLSTCRYQDIEAYQLARFDAVIHLAAHSSVAACEADPEGAWANNANDLPDFLAKLTGQPLIFASTGSLYSTRASMVYDRTKKCAEQIVWGYENAHICRFGTVCGVSPSMRGELLLNGMTRDAVRTRSISVRNQGLWRPVLFLPDLCWYVSRILAGLVKPGLHDLASFQARIGTWAAMVSEATGAKIIEASDTPTYSFRMEILEGGPGRVHDVLGDLARYWGHHDET